ncbi:uncharacterized protein LOC128966327 [Oppia nitens]|uniref:uncharacterized protein LOC128966327 n=1 Tax=Oppia nitens TaxID=1686743 RepID=UPI0023DC35CD|nr:uncharacterized protein LOC128966327 [Oppia nitens]
MSDFCNKDVIKLDVKSAFKLDQWLGIFGEIEVTGGQKSKEAFRVLYNERGDPSESQSTEHYYFDAKLWPEMRDQALDDKSKSWNISYAFSTINLRVFVLPVQSSSHVAYLTSSETDIIYAYDIDIHSPLNNGGDLKDPTFKIRNKLMVYDPNNGEDHSRKLTLKVLLLHFPSIVKVLDVMIFDHRNKNGSLAFHALVYTEEIFDNVHYYVRHFMRSDPKSYTDYENRKFHRLYWTFDEKNDYCMTLDHKVTGVTYLRTEQTFQGFAESNAYNYQDYDFNVYFIEFLGIKHRIMKLQFDAKSNTYQTFTVKDNIDNKWLLHCKPHPDYKSVPLIKCDDYINDNVDQIGNYDLIDNGGESESGSGPNGSGAWLWVVIMILIILIFLLVGYLVFMLASANSPNKSQTKSSEKSSSKP